MLGERYFLWQLARLSFSFFNAQNYRLTNVTTLIQQILAEQNFFSAMRCCTCESRVNRRKVRFTHICSLSILNRQCPPVLQYREDVRFIVRQHSATATMEDSVASFLQMYVFKSDSHVGFASRRVMELLIQEWSLSAKLRLPAISRLQKVHNVDITLQVLKSKGVDLKDERGNCDFLFFFLSERTIKRGDAQPVKVFALHRMKFYFLCVLCNVFFHRSVTHSLCFHTGLYFPPLCHFTWAWTPVFSPHTFCAGSPTAAKQHNCLLCPLWRRVGCVWTLCVNIIVCPCAVNMCQSD